MSARNTSTDFGSVAKTFHWVTAACIIIAYLSIYYVEWVLGGREARHPDRPMFMNIHWMAGLTVGAIILPRLWWKLTNVQPDPAPGRPIEHRLATLTHAALYAFLVAMPFTGYFGTGGPGTDFGLFHVPSFKNTAAFAWLSGALHVSWEEFEVPLDVVHHFLGKWVIWIVVLGHVAAALYHHFVRHDRTLLRMTTSGPLPRSGEKGAETVGEA